MSTILPSIVLAAALAAPMPAPASEFDQDAVGQALFAAFAAFIVGTIITDQRDDDPVPVRHDSRSEPPVVVAPDDRILPPAARDRGGLPVHDDLPVTHPSATGPQLGSRWRGTPLPLVCRITDTQYDATCLIDRMPIAAPLPRDCRDRKLIRNRVAVTYSASCMRDAGYRTPRH